MSSGLSEVLVASAEAGVPNSVVSGGKILAEEAASGP
jgi:hypothetical protein